MFLLMEGGAPSPPLFDSPDLPAQGRGGHGGPPSTQAHFFALRQPGDFLRGDGKKPRGIVFEVFMWQCVCRRGYTSPRSDR
jgi:hypothetical protein